MLTLFCFAGYSAGDGKRLENQHWTKRIYQQSQLNDHEIDSIQVWIDMQTTINIDESKDE